MYAGSTLKQLRTLDTWFGAHQKIDRLARRLLTELAASEHTITFPLTKQILRFEGLDGPDAIKRKTPAQDEPWHYYDPTDETDVKLLDIITDHHNNLVAALRANNITRASFEAAWIAHAVVDGLTPAHHYPYEEELARLRGGAGIETRTTRRDKIIMPGDTLRKKMRNNWEMWGDKGLLATHFSFEWGVALTILPMRSRGFEPSASKANKIARKGDYRGYFVTQAKRVSQMKLYERFYKNGWTPTLARRVRRELMPIIVETVAIQWYAALMEAEATKQ
jgi:hypothetical protein